MICLRHVTGIALPLDCVIDDVEPAKDAVEYHPENGMIDAPRNSNSKHAAKTPKAYAR